MKLKKIENRILEIKNILSDKERERKMASGIIQKAFEAQLAKANRPLLEDLDKLQIERGFIIDRRNNIFWKIVWNILIPILVSSITTYITIYLIS